MACRWRCRSASVLGCVQQEFEILSLRLVLFTRYRLSPALVWHFRLLTRLVAKVSMWPNCGNGDGAGRYLRAGL